MKCLSSQQPKFIPVHHNNNRLMKCSIMAPMSIFLFIFIWSIQLQTSMAILCQKAQMNCAFRSDCGWSLQNYLIECTDLIAGRTKRCNERCERALIGLVSSDEGKALIDCDCNNDKYCLRSKAKIQVCRSSVFHAVAQNTIVSCSTARWICISDQLCQTALDYYEFNCKQLFLGQQCSHKCNNSLSILDRQEKAIKLRTCYCDGSEHFPCRQVKYYTERLCYGRYHGKPDPYNNRIEPIGDASHSETGTMYHPQQQPHHHHHRFRLADFTGSGSDSSTLSINLLLISGTMTILFLLR